MIAKISFIILLIIVSVCANVESNKVEEKPPEDWCKDNNCKEPLTGPLADEFEYWNEMLTKVEEVLNSIENILFKNQVNIRT
jgi:hypothetical protein